MIVAAEVVEIDQRDVVGDFNAGRCFGVSIENNVPVDRQRRGAADHECVCREFVVSVNRQRANVRTVGPIKVGAVVQMNVGVIRKVLRCFGAQRERTVRQRKFALKARLIAGELQNVVGTSEINREDAATSDVGFNFRRFVLRQFEIRTRVKAHPTFARKVSHLLRNAALDFHARTGTDSQSGSFSKGIGLGENHRRILTLNNRASRVRV